ncbi:MAG TPA: hypothetical protein PKB06_08430, partial [Actinotalea sp.]|nr:hypothetical protein [Actinotalea sp.]
MDTPAVDPGAAVCAALNPVLEPRGFAAGQVGSGERVSVVFCADARALAARFGPLAGEPRPEPGRCADVVVTVGFAPDGTCYLDEVHLEGAGLDALLRAVDRHDLAPEGAGLDRPRDAFRSMGLTSVLSSSEGPVDRRAVGALAGLGAAGPLGRLPPARAVAPGARVPEG